MEALVYGGAASGKSRYAEDLLCALSGEGPRIYLATMEAMDEESRARVRRHRALRQNKGFSTLECPRDLGGLTIPVGSSVLLEDLGNLLSNEIWSPAGAGEQAETAILSGINAILNRAALLVVVSNEIFSDGAEWTDDMARYVQSLGRLHQALADRAETVVEVVCGIPVYHKRGGR